MDPNACLDEIRRITAKADCYGENGTLSDDDTTRLVELTQALDQWLVSGGFLPDAWKNGRRDD